MGADYHIAVHEPDWPSFAQVNECMVDRSYPLHIRAEKESEPLNQAPETLGLSVEFEKKPLEIEASIVQLSETTSYAYKMVEMKPVNQHVVGEKAENPTEVRSELDEPRAMGVQLDFDGFRSFDPLATEPADINADLKGLGSLETFQHGDYVMTISLGNTKREWRAASYLMGAMGLCFNALIFEFQSNTFGRAEYSESLVEAAAKKPLWKQ